LLNSNYSIIATDTAVTYDDGCKEWIENNGEKLYQLEGGWASGCGSASIIKATASDISFESIHSFERINSIYQRHYYNCLDLISSNYDQSMSLTKVAYSYATRIEGSVIHRINVIGHNYQRVVEKNSLFSIWPTDVSSNVREEIIDHYTKLVELNVDHSDNLSIMITLISQFISDVAKESKYVSSYCDAGISLTDDKEIAMCRISADTKEILEAYTRGDSFIQFMNKK